ncbi:MAG TPA: hypothetical protein VMX16_20035 [Terriglobia bacterium]|nr:hypothetical protein [Terriglobia bacterium]
MMRGTGRETSAGLAAGHPAIATSQGLTWLWQHLQEVRHPYILDCGAISPATLKVLMERKAKLFVADLLSVSLDGEAKLWDRNQKVAVFKTSEFISYLPDVPTGSLSAILSWNLLDLLPEAARLAVMDKLFSFLQPLGVIFSFLREPSQKLGVGRRWWLESQNQVRMDQDEKRAFPYPPVSNRGIEKLVPGGNVKIFLTRSGRREVLSIKG